MIGMDLIRRFFAWFWGKVLRRTGYKAMIDGVIIDGCGCGCKHNNEMQTSPVSPKTHCCTALFQNGTGDLKTIWDPYDIPEFCPYRVTIPEMDK